MELEKSNNLQKRLKNLANKLREDENRVLFGKSNEISGKLEKTSKIVNMKKIVVFGLMTNLKKVGKNRDRDCYQNPVHSGKVRY